MRKGERKQGWWQAMSASADGMHPKLKGWRSCMQSITLSTVLGKEIGICYLLYRWPVQGHQSYNPPYKWKQSPQPYSRAGLAAPIQGRNMAMGIRRSVFPQKSIFYSTTWFCSIFPLKGVTSGSVGPGQLQVGTFLSHQLQIFVQAAMMGKYLSNQVCYLSYDYAAEASKKKKTNKNTPAQQHSFVVWFKACSSGMFQCRASSSPVAPYLC